MPRAHRSCGGLRLQVICPEHDHADRLMLWFCAKRNAATSMTFAQRRSRRLSGCQDTPPCRVAPVAPPCGDEAGLKWARRWKRRRAAIAFIVNRMPLVPGFEAIDFGFHQHHVAFLRKIHGALTELPLVGAKDCGVATVS